MICVDNQHLLMIEPSSPPGEPLIDAITRKMVAAWRSRTTSTRRYRGWHSCTGHGCEAQSDNTDHVVDGRTTNSLCVHYVAMHRSEVPVSELSLIMSWSAEAAPTADELGPIYWRRDKVAQARWDRRFAELAAEAAATKNES